MNSLSEQRRDPTTNSDRHKASTPGFEPGPHCWEASALTTLTAQPLLPLEAGEEKNERSFQLNSTIIDL